MDEKGEDGDTALNIACLYGQQAVVTDLIRRCRRAPFAPYLPIPPLATQTTHPPTARPRPPANPHPPAVLRPVGTHGNPVPMSTILNPPPSPQPHSLGSMSRPVFPPFNTHTYEPSVRSSHTAFSTQSYHHPQGAWSMKYGEDIPASLRRYSPDTSTTPFSRGEDQSISLQAACSLQSVKP